MGLTLIILAAYSAPSQAGLPDRTVPQIEATVLASRREIRRGKLAFEWTSRNRKGVQADQAATVWFDYDKDELRTDWTIKPSAGDPFRRIECRNCEKAGYYVLHDEVRMKDGGKMVVLLAPLKGKVQHRLTLFDPRLIGFVPDQPAVLQHLSLETVLGKGDRLNQTLKQERLRGEDCYVIAFDTKNKQHYEYWAAPSKGYMLLRISVTNTRSKDTRRAVVDNELEQFGPGGVWFPKTSTFTSRRNDEVDTTATIRVNSAEFNGPIDEAAFTLAGMGLREGSVVALTKPDGSSEPYSWKAQKLETYTPPPFVLPTPPEERRRWWLYGVAGGFATLALGALVLFWRRKTPAPPAPRIP